MRQKRKNRNPRNKCFSQFGKWKPRGRRFIGDGLIRDAIKPSRGCDVGGIEKGPRLEEAVRAALRVLGFTVWHVVEGESAGQAARGETLTPSQRKWIASADTFFIASGYRGEGDSASFGMDASHRGGEPRFVEIVDETRLLFPDYAGNNHYNTIGNLILDPRVGLLFVDFATGSLLQLTGHATIDWDSGDVARFPGARRLVAIDIEEIVELPKAVSLRWDASADSVRSLRLVDKIPESDDVTSFVFESRDGGPLPIYEAGQHLPIELDRRSLLSDT